MSKNIQGKVVLITGGSTGIGAEVARLLAGRGARVAITAAGGTARAYQLDVTDKRQVEAVVAATVADFGRLDVLINNAGLMPIRPMSEVNTDEWDAMIDVNLKGTLYGIAAALPRGGEGYRVCHRAAGRRRHQRDRHPFDPAGFLSTPTSNFLN